MNIPLQAEDLKIETEDKTCSDGNLRFRFSAVSSFPVLLLPWGVRISSMRMAGTEILSRSTPHRREAPASLDAPRRPEMRPPPAPAAGADAAKVRSACAAEIEAYLSTMESEQQRRFADK